MRKRSLTIEEKRILRNMYARARYWDKKACNAKTWREFNYPNRRVIFIYQEITNFLTERGIA